MQVSINHETRNKTTVAVTEWHGAIDEQANNASPDISYVSALCDEHWLQKLIKSPIKGFFPAVNSGPGDIVEGVISPVITKRKWVCSLATYEEALAFSILGMPTPRVIRQFILNRLFLKKNFLGFSFWSNAGMQTLRDAGLCGSSELLSKSCVIYPAVSRRPDRVEGERNIILFSGDFFRKGGVNVVDAFERLSHVGDGLLLRLCCDLELDFNTSDRALRIEYINKVKRNPKIVLGRVPRRVLLDEILPRSVLYLLPTYDETFGFALLEALAAGVPVIATREFAIPEIIDDGETGWLIDYTPIDKSRIMDGYIVKVLPEDIKSRLTDDLYQRLVVALVDRAFLSQMGRRAQEVARTKFSFETRNRMLAKIYGLS
jgi:glycosyltransferase involved in cell wall biosynthesis